MGKLVMFVTISEYPPKGENAQKGDYVAMVFETDVPDNNNNWYFVEICRIVGDLPVWVETWHSSRTYASAASAALRLF